MKTSYFWKAMHEPELGTKYISISRKNQRGAENMPQYAALQPSWHLINLAHQMEYSKESLTIYKGEYYEQLNHLDAEEVYEDLKEYTIVCSESSKDLVSGKKYCHRQMVVGWIESKLGIIIPEETREKERHLIVPAIYE